LTILDAEQTDRVFLMEDCDNNIISNLTIMGGDSPALFAGSGGGGMHLFNSNPTLTNVTIASNTVRAQGGGMYLNHSDPILTNVTIANNTAEHYGGGMYLYISNPTITNVTITNNTAEYRGGGMYLWYSNPILNHVTISENTAGWRGGGMYLTNLSNPTLRNVTIADNTATEYYGGGMQISSSNPTIINSIIWDNSPESISENGSFNFLIVFSDIEGGWEEETGYCIGNNEYCHDANLDECVNMIVFELCDEWIAEITNINSDPLFTDPENGDYTLQESSPCIDAGIIIEDMEYCGSAPDMGAYEYCEECGAELGDVTGDSEINILDLVQIANLILETSTPAFECAADYNGDGQVNILDLVQIANYILDN